VTYRYLLTLLMYHTGRSVQANNGGVRAGTLWSVVRPSHNTFTDDSLSCDAWLCQCSHCWRPGPQCSTMLILRWVFVPYFNNKTLLFMVF